MADLSITIGKTPKRFTEVGITNQVGTALEFHIQGFSGDMFSILAEPIEMMLRTDGGASLLPVKGVCYARRGGVWLGHSQAKFTDLVTSSRHWQDVSPAGLIDKLFSPYRSVAYKNNLPSNPISAFTQYQESDLDFAVRVNPNVLFVDDGCTLHIGEKNIRTTTLTPLDMSYGSGDWVIDIQNTPIQAFAMGLEPHELIDVELAFGEVAPNRDLKRYQAAAARYAKGLPSAVMEIVAVNRESLRKQINALLLRQYAHAMSYSFRTTTNRVRVGDRLVFPPIVQDVQDSLRVCRTEGHFANGAYCNTVYAVPEPLLGYFALLNPPRCESLLPAIVQEGADPKKRGRVPIIFAHDTKCVRWANVATLHASKELQMVTKYHPGEVVLVGFMQADPAYPVILSSLYTNKLRQPDLGTNEYLLKFGKHSMMLSSDCFEILFGDSRWKISATGLEWSHGQNKVVLDKDCCSIQARGHTWRLGE